MKILEAYKRLGLEDPLKFYRGIKDPNGNFRRNGKTTRIAIEMTLDICACKDSNTRFLILGTAPECEDLHSTALTFVNQLCASKLHYLLERRHICTEDRLRGRSNCFVYSDPIEPRVLPLPIRHARKFFPLGQGSCRVLDRDDIMVWEGKEYNLTAYLDTLNMCVDNVVTGDRIWSQLHCWKV